MNKFSCIATIYLYQWLIDLYIINYLKTQHNYYLYTNSKILSQINIRINNHFNDISDKWYKIDTILSEYKIKNTNN